MWRGEEVNVHLKVLRYGYDDRIHREALARQLRNCCFSFKRTMEPIIVYVGAVVAQVGGHVGVRAAQRYFRAYIRLVLGVAGRPHVVSEGAHIEVVSLAYLVLAPV